VGNKMSSKEQMQGREYAEIRKKNRRANRRLKYINKEPGMETKNCEGYNDYTPFNAVTGNELLSKTVLINPERKTPGHYNG
jgi:hypothetical protein